MTSAQDVRYEMLRYSAPVPANASRFFDSPEVAVAQQEASIQLAWAEQQPLLVNVDFDETLIRYDACYCTSVVDLDRVVQVPTMSYFGSRIDPHLSADASIVDIGCGQGEFVERLGSLGRSAIGYDPVLQRPAPHLHDRYWTPSEPPADLFVMRCVLPHIPDPWGFLDQLAVNSPGSLVLIEFQRLEWIIDEAIWYQISHDHVNLFRLLDFERRYRVLEHGEFSNGEWAWVLVDPSTRRDASAACDLGDELAALGERRVALLERCRRLGRPLAIWGAAGKGTVLAFDLQRAGARVVAIDADPLRWGRYLESSGAQILPPADALASMPADTLILVCNPNHLESVRDRVAGRYDVRLPSAL